MATQAPPRQDSPDLVVGHRGRPAVADLARRQPRPAHHQTVIWMLGCLSAVAAWLLMYAFVLSGFQEAGAQKALYASLRTEIAQGIAPLGGNIPLGQPVAILQVPQAGINDVVLEGTTSGILESGPGLEADTPLPGLVGLSKIYGRQSLFGAPFRHLAALRPGDHFQAITGAGTFIYRVDDVRHPGDPLPQPPVAGEGKMILITAAGSGWRGAGAPNQLLYVDATLLSKPVPALPGMPTAITASQQPMQGDTSVLFALVLWLQLLLLTVLALVWARSRWSGWQTWLVGAPALLAIVWVVSEVAFQLLPNLL